MKVLIIGGCGYVGSRLYYEMAPSMDFDVTSVDLEWFGNPGVPDNIVVDYRHLPQDFYKGFEAVILLAGHSSVPMSKGMPESTHSNNVSNFLDLMGKLGKDQVLVYASSSSVYNSGSDVREEDPLPYSPANPYDLSKFEIDMWAALSNKRYYALRFGTVNGWSPNLRTDIMINRMWESAKNTGSVRVANPQIWRPILGMEDLVYGILSLLRKPGTPGVYNMASFNARVGEIGEAVSKVTEAKIIEEPPTPCYDFSMVSEKFCREYGFRFRDTPSSIVCELEDRDPVIRGTRSKAKFYV